MKNLFYLQVTVHKTQLRLFERIKSQVSGLVVNFDQIPWSWIRDRIRIPNTDPEDQCGFMRFRIRIRIHYPVFFVVGMFGIALAEAGIGTFWAGTFCV